MTTIGAAFEQEYETLTRGCGLLDRSERGKLALSGSGAKDFLQGQVTNDILSLTPGRGVYAVFLTQKGKMQGDLRVLDTGDELLLDTERVALQDLFNMIRSYSLGYEVELHKRTLESGLFSLIGPGCEKVLKRLGVNLPGEEHSHLQFSAAGGRVRAIRTDVGVDVLFEAELSDGIGGALQEAGAVPVAEPAAECVRIERGRPRFGIDLDNSVIPQEAGLNERAVSFTKGCYVGQETVARLFYKGKPNRELRGVLSAEPLSPGAALRFDGRDVATVTSSAISPRVGPIALALVRREAPVGSVVTTPDGASAQVVALPFITPSTYTAKNG